MDDSFRDAAAIGLCLLFSAFSSGMHTALTSLGEPRARQLVEEQGHKLMRLWLDKPERVLASLLVTGTSVNALAAVLMTRVLERLLPALGGAGALALATGLTALLVLTFAEVPARAIARQSTVRLVPLAMPVVLALDFLARPIVSVLLRALRWFDRVLSRGENPSSPEPSVTSEEIEYMIDLGVKQGVLDREKSELLTSVLEFSDIVTREIMVPRMNVVALPVDASREDVLRVVLDSEHSRIPVYDGSIDEIVGVLYVKSMLADFEAHPDQPFDLRRYVRPPYFVPELMKISRLLREFQLRKVHLAIVVDEFGGTAGVAALEDVVEEIVGEIQDEQDEEESQIRLLPTGAILADAALTLRDLEVHLEVDFPDELDADSLGGFVTAMAGKVPSEGSVIVWQGLQFTVRAADERRVTRVEIDRVQEPGADGPGEALNTDEAEARSDLGDVRSRASGDEG